MSLNGGYWCRVCGGLFANQAAAQCHRVGTHCLSAAQLQARGWDKPGKAWHLPRLVGKVRGTR
jgi:hypothetical protein